MSYITIEAEIDMRDIDLDDLLDELKRRRKLPKEYDNDDPDGYYTKLMDHEKLELIKKIVGLQSYESKERVFDEIKLL